MTDFTFPSTTQKNKLTNIRDEVNKGSGYTKVFTLTAKELADVRAAVNSQWLNQITASEPKIAQLIRTQNLCITDYHKISQYLDHATLWSKQGRMMPIDFTKLFLSSGFACKLSDAFGEYTVSDEENLGYSNIYWRIVRPSHPNDIGPLHRDAWYWNLNKHYPRPSYPHQRIKVWIPLYIEAGKNGLLVEAGSQQRDDIEWKAELRHGVHKPALLNSSQKVYPKLVVSQPGEAIVFHDSLLHGGALNHGSFCRISIEFTMLVRIN